MKEARATLTHISVSQFVKQLKLAIDLLQVEHHVPALCHKESQEQMLRGINASTYRLVRVLPNLHGLINE